MAASMVDGLVEVVNGYLASGRYRVILPLLKGFRNGAVYGMKIRASHALVMTFLYGRGSFLDKLRVILRQTYTHSRSLALYVLIYKAMLAVLRLIEGTNQQIHPVIAGFVGGYFIWGENNKVNSQVLMYSLSRLLIGFARLAVKRNVIKQPKKDIFPLYAAIVSAITMWQFEYHSDIVQPSMRSSMTYLYHDSNR
ncbi:peroxisomal membrane protein 4-like [Amphiura filiformis]|uniref:peroxisomal membrane protein 4-like n=1 Tax=Amphiura filiformis TaxID=82378 RepID=UPI003B20DCD5